MIFVYIIGTFIATCGISQYTPDLDSGTAAPVSIADRLVTIG